MRPRVVVEFHVVFGEQTVDSLGKPAELQGGDRLGVGRGRGSEHDSAEPRDVGPLQAAPQGVPK